jgi:hypothetical protein
MITPTLLRDLGPTALREIASVMEATSPASVGRSRLTDEGRADLADMLLSGRKPTIGWWERHLKGTSHDALT